MQKNRMEVKEIKNVSLDIKPRWERLYKTRFS